MTDNMPSCAECYSLIEDTPIFFQLFKETFKKDDSDVLQSYHEGNHRM